MSEIRVPKGWNLTKLGNICNIVSGTGFPITYQKLTLKGIPFIKVSDMNEPNNEKYVKTNSFYVDEETISKIKATKYPKNTIIFPKVGGALLTNKRRILSKESCFDNNIMGLISKDGIDYEFLYYFMTKIDLRAFAKSGPVPSINKSDIEQIEILVPPIEIQKKIVQKLNNIFSIYESKRKMLTEIYKRKTKEMSTGSKVLRRKIISTAFEGKLWKVDNGKDIQILIKQISIHKKELWKQSLVKAGKFPEKYKYVEPELSPSERLLKLPKNWTWVTLDQITEKITDGTHFKPHYINDGIPFISVKDIQDGKLSFENCKFISPEDHRKMAIRSHPEYDDILITKTGATIGKIAIVKQKIEFNLFVSVALIKPIKKYVISEFLAYALENHVNQINLNDLKGGVIKNYHIEDLRKINLPLMPYDEQKQLVNIINSRLKEIKIINLKLEEIIMLQTEINNYLNKIPITIMNQFFSDKIIN